MVSALKISFEKVSNQNRFEGTSSPIEISNLSINMQSQIQID